MKLCRYRAAQQFFSFFLNSPVRHIFTYFYISVFHHSNEMRSNEDDDDIPIPLHTQSFTPCCLYAVPPTHSKKKLCVVEVESTRVTREICTISPFKICISLTMISISFILMMMMNSLRVFFYSHQRKHACRGMMQHRRNPTASTLDTLPFLSPIELDLMHTRLSRISQ